MPVDDPEVHAEVVRVLNELRLLGCALTGSRDWTAELCETRQDSTGQADLTEAAISSWRLLTKAGTREPVPLTWALPGIMELRARGA